MRLATLQEAGGTLVCAQTKDGFIPVWDGDVASLVGRSQWQAIVALALSAASASDVLDPAEVTLAPLATTPRKIICCGLNYADHITEMGRELPQHPTLFAKFSDTLCGAQEDIRVSASRKVDWEAELAVMVGRRLSGASEEQAAEAIAGYTVANDVSMRDWQNRTLQWFQGKAFDATTPIGPVLVTADEFDADPTFDVSCFVNDERVQHGNTGTLVFSPAALLAYISSFTTLRPGDLVLTGTPGGVGAGAVPPRFLKDGDVLRTEVSGLGTLTNRVVLVD